MYDCLFLHYINYYSQYKTLTQPGRGFFGHFRIGIVGEGGGDWGREVCGTLASPIAIDFFD